ncbi:MAG: hypothetical protein IID16_12005 [Candidatus Marinimicrobia bacterium]|nr:hypothetical protein [Candidatus Neomarinimicrobiota bacterium]
MASLKNSLEVLMSSQVPQDFKVLKGASQFTLVKEEINTRTNDKNEFSIFTEVKLAVMGFREKDILAVFESKIKEEFGLRIERIN